MGCFLTEGNMFLLYNYQTNELQLCRVDANFLAQESEKALQVYGSLILGLSL